MIQLLFAVIFTEAAMIALLLFKTPLRKLVIMALDRLKRGRGPLMVKTVAGTLVVVLSSSVYSMINIQKRGIEDGGAVNPTDQVLMAKHLLEATLMGAVLFLALMIDRLHHYIRELRIRRKSMEAVKKQMRGSEDVKTASSEETKYMEERAAKLREEVVRLESELKSKNKAVGAAEANVSALRKQSEGFLLEYDRLLEENQSLRNQLQSVDRTFSRSASKKNTLSILVNMLLKK
ncbi:B-cell receptor-associated protein 29-like [Trifolium pratense]|uniref:Endoplasmic reticulum transmembrane protein n=2 Tax=Trifolium pratense TaxID=57577 RepID=A0A2K3NCW1_TRIPR|nr:B-cell receptor-associated protein 29-like [Trifolium pratense]PNY00870.1 B-cell receptor-associated protein 29-like [Trifolium pratense]